MTGLIKKAVLGVSLAASTLAATSPAEAQYYRRHRGGDTTGAAILGGIVGLGVGAAIASSNNNRRYNDRYYDRGYAYDGYYAQPRGYYYDDYRDNYRPRCYYQRQYDRWSGRPYDVRVCR